MFFSERRILPDPLAAVNWNTMLVPQPPRQKPSMHTALILLACLAAYGLATYLLQVPLWVGLAYLSLSLITIAFYTWDKAQARAGQWRISERTLHGLALAG